MEPLDASFVDIFLDFLNDRKADAWRVAKAFSQHEYVKKRIGMGVFQVSTDKAHYREMQTAMRSELSELLKEKGWNLDHRRRIADELNRRPLKIKIAGGLELEVSGIVIFTAEGKGVVPKVRYAVNGVEYACWLALAIISRDPEKIRSCPWLNCGKFFVRTRKHVSFCCKRHQVAAERVNKDVRSWNLRHPDEIRKIPYQTIKKPRRSQFETKTSESQKR